MKISHRNVPYSDIPRLVKEGVIKVGTRVRACEDQKKYPNGIYLTMPNGVVGRITNVNESSISISCEDRFYKIDDLHLGRCIDFFLDILSDEDEEVEKKSDTDDVCVVCGSDNLLCADCEHNDEWYCHECESYTSRCERKDFKPKPLSFSEPLTKEAVGRVIYSQHYGKETIDNLSIDGEWLKVNTGGWGKREHYRDAGWHFESSTDEITIEEAEKLTGKKIKR